MRRGSLITALVGLGILAATATWAAQGKKNRVALARFRDLLFGSVLVQMSVTTLLRPVMQTFSGGRRRTVLAPDIAAVVPIAMQRTRRLQAAMPSGPPTRRPL